MAVGDSEDLTESVTQTEYALSLLLYTTHVPEMAGTEPKQLWMEFFDKSQLTMLLIGLGANIITVTTLVKNGRAFSPAISILLRHQSVVDACVCTIGAITLVQPFMWLTGSKIVDFIICHVWHSQNLYFIFLTTSTYNLVVIAFERFLAVCYPFRHQGFTRGTVYKIVGCLHLFSFIFVFPGFLQVYYTDGMCLNEFSIQGEVGKIFMSFFAIFCFAAFYAVPCALFVILYGMVIITFRRRQNNQEFANSRVIDRATTELTKTAFAVTIIFVLALGYDLWYYVLGYAGVVEYKVNTFVQKVGVWLSAFNCCANPFVYALLMPAYRASIRITFWSCTKTMTSNATTSGITESNKDATPIKNVE